MFLITVSYGTTACPLLFKSAESATAAWDALSSPVSNIPQGPTPMEELRAGYSMQNPARSFPVHVYDDFGRQLRITTDKIAGLIYEDLEQSKEGQIEQALHNARTQAAATQRGQGDPKLQAASRLQGPAVFSPGMNGSGRMF